MDQDQTGPMGPPPGDMGPGPDGPMGPPPCMADDGQWDHLQVIWDQDQMDQWDHLR